MHWCGNSPRRPANTMAALINPPRRDFLEYLSDTSESIEVRAGSPLPLGTQESGGGVNFAIFSRNASRVRLELFNQAEDATPIRFFDFNSARNRTGDVWHVWVKRDRPRSTLCLPGGWPLPTQRRSSFQFQKAAARSLCRRNFKAAPMGFPIGMRIRHGVTATRPDHLKFR